MKAHRFISDATVQQLRTAPQDLLSLINHFKGTEGRVDKVAKAGKPPTQSSTLTPSSTPAPMVLSVPQQQPCRPRDPPLNRPPQPVLVRATDHVLRRSCRQRHLLRRRQPAGSLVRWCSVHVNRAPLVDGTSAATADATATSTARMDRQHILQVRRHPVLALVTEVDYVDAICLWTRIECQARHGHGSIFCNPIQPNPSLFQPNPTNSRVRLAVLTQPNPTQPNPLTNMQDIYRHTSKSKHI